MVNFAEALVLGIGSGPVCLASCGPVLLPWMAAENRDLRGNASLLARFLAGRLVGYLAFAVAAWAAGLALPLDARLRTLVFGLANLALAVFLSYAALRPRRACHFPAHPAGTLLQIAPAPAQHGWQIPTALSLGFLTGLNLCPPFVAAGLRAAQLNSLTAALVFFVVFFLGTAVWFAPTLAIAPLRRHAAVPAVARIIMGVLAVYYLYLGILSCVSFRSLSLVGLFNTSSSTPWRFFHV